MYTRINTGVAYLERNEMEINIWVFKNKRKIEFFEFFNIKYQKRVTMRVTITVRKCAIRRPCYRHLQCQHC